MIQSDTDAGNNKESALSTLFFLGPKTAILRFSAGMVRPEKEASIFRFGQGSGNTRFTVYSGKEVPS